MNETRENIGLTQLLRRGQQLQSPGPQVADWLTPLRQRGAAAMLDSPLPNRKNEAWRYTPLSFLEQAEYVPFQEEAFSALQFEDIDELLLGDQERELLVFVNGRLAPSLCSLSGESRGVLISTLGGGLGEVPAVLQQQLGQFTEQHHVFSALNAALMTDGAIIQVTAGEHAQTPIEILHVSVGLEEPGIYHPRHLIVLEEGARAEVIERYCSLGESTYFNNAAIGVSLCAGSELMHVRLQEESCNAQHLSDLRVRLQEHSRYRLVQPIIGAAWSRTDVQVTFNGEQAEAELDGLLLARDKQLTDVHLDICHEAPGCTSRETFKGILDGKGRVVFDGLIRVARDAQKTDAQLTNDNLMLSRGAEVDTKPQLEIFADDVKCSHGTTVGEIDSDMLFYLQSRGIPQARAIQMLCQGFAQAVLDRLPGKTLRNHAASLLEERLTETAASMEKQA